MPVDLQTENELLRMQNEQLRIQLVKLTIGAEMEKGCNHITPRGALIYIAERFGVKVEELSTKTRRSNAIAAKKAVAYILRTQFDLVYEEITKIVSQTTGAHSTARSLFNSAKKEVDSGTTIGKKIIAIEFEVGQLKEKCYGGFQQHH